MTGRRLTKNKHLIHLTYLLLTGFFYVNYQWLLNFIYNYVCVTIDNRVLPLVTQTCIIIVNKDSTPCKAIIGYGPAGHYYMYNNNNVIRGLHYVPRGVLINRYCRYHHNYTKNLLIKCALNDLL